MNTDTPRTDDNTIRIEFSDGPFQNVVYVTVEFSKTLERELTAVTAELDEYRGTAEQIGAKKAASELATVTAERDKLRGIIYRFTVAHFRGERDPLSFVPAQDVKDSLEIVRTYQAKV